MIFLARLVHYAFSLYTLGLVIYIMCSWIAHPTAHAVHIRLARWYEPLLTPIRRMIPGLRLGGAMLDLSPVLLLIGLSVLRGLLISLLIPPF